MADLDEYLTVAEFAALSSVQQHAVWTAHAEKHVDAVAVPGHSRRYRRADVEDVLRGLEAPRG